MRKPFGAFLRRGGLYVRRHVKELGSLFFFFDIAQLCGGVSPLPLDDELKCLINPETAEVDVSVTVLLWYLTDSRPFD